MSYSRLKTEPDFSLDSPAHIEARNNREDNIFFWQRNVIDKFKTLSTEQIKSELEQTAHPFAVLFENFTGDFNLATGIRNANAFNAKEIFYIGDKRWDKRGAVGVFNYSPVNWLSSIDELLKLKEKYAFVGVDNVPGSIPMETYKYPIPSLLIFGQESVGLTPKMRELCENIIHITMFGSVRSFNCGTASGIAMYDFVCKLQK